MSKFLEKKALIKASTLVVCLSALFGCGNPLQGGESTQDIVLTTSEENLSSFLLLSNNFNESQTKYKINVKTLPTYDLIKYSLRHKALDTDIVTFNNLNAINKIKDSLYPLTRLDAVGKYQITILNKLKGSDDVLRIIPSPGAFYGQCYNMDLMDKRNFVLPDTIEDLITFARQMEVYGNAYSSINGDQMFINSFMEVAVPTFISSTKGGQFLTNYYYGNTKIEGSEHEDTFTQICNNYKSLFSAGYYVATDAEQDEDYGKDKFFKEGLSTIYAATPLEDIPSEYAKSEATFPYQIYPSVGNASNQKWVLSKPDYYLGVLNSAATNKEKLKGIEAFFDYFVSEEGQATAMLKEDGEKRSNSISYIRDADIALDEQYTHMIESIKSGKVYVTDTFESVFSLNPTALKDFATNQITSDELIKELDKSVLEHASGSSFTCTFNTSLEYDENLLRSKETLLGNFVSDSIRQFDKSDIVLIPSKVVNGSIYEGLYVQEDIEDVFSSCEVIRARIKGESLNNLLKLLVNLKNEDDFPLISGVRIKEENNVFNSYYLNNQKISPTDVINVLIPTSYLSLIDENEIVSIGNTFQTTDILLEGLDKMTIDNIYLDGRYGNME